MLSWGDEYPIHQTPEPIAFAGSDRNFYDRYFYNGYQNDGDIFFACAFGVYPHLNIMDGAFSILLGDGIQRSLFLSRPMNMERMDTRIEGFSIEVIKPLSQIRLRLEETQGLAFDLTFSGRAFPIEEPRFTHRQGTRMLMDLTRMTQNGFWQGWLRVDSKKIDIDPKAWRGTRDRSWGIRPVGTPDPQTPIPPIMPQFYWIWTPLNFADRSVFFHVNDDAAGRVWNKSGKIIADGTQASAQDTIEKSDIALEYVSGTRRAAKAVIEFQHETGEQEKITLTPQQIFLMKGLGYGHPERRHGSFQGYEAVVTREDYNLHAIDMNALEHLHIQAVAMAQLEDASGNVQKGIGVCEQLFIGPHAPSGWTDLLDGAK